VDKQETWQNTTEGTVILKRLDHRGEFGRIETVVGGRTFNITIDERRQNSVEAASADLDVFRNGVLAPVRLLDDSDEARELASNPNVMTETDMRKFVMGGEGFEERLAQIHNGATLDRLLAAAYEENAPVKRVEAIQARIAEVQPKIFATGEQKIRAPRPVTPR
jgi:hypothetical protein